MESNESPEIPDWWETSDIPGLLLGAEGSGEQGKMEETGCEIICGAPVTLMVKGQMKRDEMRVRLIESAILILR